MASEDGTDILDVAAGWERGGRSDRASTQHLVSKLAAEIRKLRSEVSRWKATANHESATIEYMEAAIISRPTPTLAEVAMHLAAGMLTNPVNDSVSVELFVRSACDVAEALLAELERRGK